MMLRKLSKIASIGMAVIGLVVVPPLRAFQTEGTTKAVTKQAKKSASSPTDTVKSARSTRANTVSASDISAAKASGKVWVNNESRVYHKSRQWYGATKQGKFMTEQEAKQAGYRAAKSK
jgi:hypothetical protein